MKNKANLNIYYEINLFRRTIMSSKKRKKNNANNKISDNIDKKVIENNDDDMKECDKILEQLDEIEQNSDISSKVKSLIQRDKEAIKKMNEKVSKLEDEDDLDYLEDEPELENNAEVKTENDIEEANLDFLANLNKDDNIIEDDRIRKKQPKRLANDDNTMGFFDKVKLAAGNNTRNFVAGTAIAFLFVILIIALAIDSNNKVNDKAEAISGEFIEIDTTPMIDAINNYYAALGNGEVDVIRNLMSDSSKIDDEEIKEKCDEAKAYSELVGTSFIITDCYVQNGLKKNEYIAYMKFQIKIKSIETPSVGIFTCYFVDMSTKDKVDYKISVGVNDKSSEVYKYILKMSSCKNVTDLFEKVNKELEEACKKDEALKAIVDALEANSDTDMKDVDEATTEPVKTETKKEETTAAKK